MAICINSTLKKCATCESWGGLRETNFSGREVKIKNKPNDSDAGICNNRKSIKNGRTVRGGDFSCNAWIKWGVLK